MNANEFARQIHAALEHLHDFPYLLSLPLTRALRTSELSREAAARGLRSAILEAISKLEPDLASETTDKEQRGYTILFGRYVQGMSTKELMDELGISLRQLRREERRAFEAVTTLLWDRFGPLLVSHGELSGEDGNAAPRSLTQAETQQFLARAESSTVDLKEILDGVLETLAPLLQQRRLQVLREEKGASFAILADRVAMRQTILLILLQALSGLASGRLSVSLSYESASQIALDVHAGPYDVLANQGEDRLAMARELILKQGGLFEARLSGALWHARIEMPTARDYLVILAIDDNENLIELFKRYTAGTIYHVIGARSGQEALEQVHRCLPHLITLDVMMPRQDGWEILQHLRALPELTKVPIVVCSVMNEPGLAAMLGASDFLPKPVTQDALLSMLGKWATCLPH